MKVVFLGTPNFAKIVLEKIYASNHEIVAVVCAADKPKGRGNKLTPPETKIFAMQNGIPFYQFSKIRVEGVEILKSLKADIFVTAAFGQILSQEIIDIPKHGIINVHGSLLPKYRGASPVQTAILEGETETGVTIMQTQIGIDDGDMLLSGKIKIEPEDNSGSLMEKLAYLGADLAVKALDQIENNTAVFTAQNHDQATFTKMLKKSKAKLNFKKSSHRLFNFVRAYNPNPMAFFNYENEQFKVLETRVADMENQGKQPGTVIISSGRKGLFVACGEGVLEIVTLGPEGKKPMSAKSYLNAKKITESSVLNE